MPTLEVQETVDHRGNISLEQRENYTTLNRTNQPFFLHIWGHLHHHAKVQGLVELIRGFTLCCITCMQTTNLQRNPCVCVRPNGSPSSIHVLDPHSFVAMVSIPYSMITLLVLSESSFSALIQFYTNVKKFRAQMSRAQRKVLLVHKGPSLTTCSIVLTSHFNLKGLNLLLGLKCVNEFLVAEQLQQGHACWLWY